MGVLCELVSEMRRIKDGWGTYGARAHVRGLACALRDCLPDLVRLALGRLCVFGGGKCEGGGERGVEPWEGEERAVPARHRRGLFVALYEGVEAAIRRISVSVLEKN